MGPGAFPSGEIEHRAALSLLLKGRRFPGPRGIPPRGEKCRHSSYGEIAPRGGFQRAGDIPAGHLLIAWVASTGPV